MLLFLSPLPLSSHQRPTSLQPFFQRSPTPLLLPRPAPRRRAQRAPGASPLRLSASPPSPPSPPRRGHPPLLPLLSALSKVLAAVGLAALLMVPAFPGPAAAAVGGGRLGGSHFRSAPRMAPRGGGGGGGWGGAGLGRGGSSVLVMPGAGWGWGWGPGPGYYYGGYGIGGGGLGLLGVVALGGFLAMRAMPRLGAGVGLLEEETAEDGWAAADSGYARGSVLTVKVGLLASARRVGLELERLARGGDTGTVAGLRRLMEEVVVALLRCPDYWVYGAVDRVRGGRRAVERTFNERTMTERLKLQQETLSNVGGRIRETPAARAAAQDYSKPPAEFIVVTMTVAAMGPLGNIPTAVNSIADLQRVLRGVGAISTDALQGCEVIWAPQSLQHTLTEKELLLDHPELRRL